MTNKKEWTNENESERVQKRQERRQKMKKNKYPLWIN